jgi:hypothetical protein
MVGSLFPFNEGKALVHEVGHWLGLLYTFRMTLIADLGLFSRLIYGVDQLNCRNTSDGVRYTPRQASPTHGRPTRRNSCWCYRGVDPIHNYMDNSDNSCSTEFTRGQMNRMKATSHLYQ